MTLAVIGSGFGRTGTKSLKEALEYYGPCHHMHEILENPEQVPHWQRVAQGHDVDWGEVFDIWGQSNNSSDPEPANRRTAEPPNR